MTQIRASATIEYIGSLIWQPDNKIVAVGVSHTNNTDVALARYHPDGALDSTFGTGGTVTTPIGTSNDRGKASVLQNDGKILVLGDHNSGGQDKIFLARYNTDGSLDITFDGDGKVITQIGGHDGAGGIVLQPDGKIVIAGGTNFNSTADTFVARYNPDGSLDQTFGTSGKVLQSFSSGADAARSLVLLPDDKIILGGYENTGSGLDFALRQFNSDGTIDTTFGTNGSFITQMSPGDDFINSLTLQSDGKLLATGPVHNGTHNDWGIVRYADIGINLPVIKFSQNNILWGEEEYDHGNSQSLSCGSTLTECGCAMTSLAMLLNYHNVVNPSDGTEITPKNLNNYFNRDAQCGAGGCISFGFMRGDVRWGAADDLSAEANRNYGTQKIIYNGDGVFNAATIKEDIVNGLPVILGVPNHWVLATGISDSTFKIHDPLFNVFLLSDPAYNNTASQGIRRYKKTNSDFSKIEIGAFAPAQVIITDPDGNKTGFNNTLQSFAKDIPNSDYFFDEAYINNQQENSRPSIDKGVYWARILTPKQGKYFIDVISAPNKLYSFAVYDSNKSAKVKFKLYERNQSEKGILRYILDYNPSSDDQIIRIEEPDAAAPNISIKASPDKIWPPNGKMVNVEITGTSSDDNLAHTTFEVIDEYGLVEPSIPATTSTEFSRTIKLEAKRKGNDEDGRLYTIKAKAIDIIGNSSIAETTVIVPRDQGKN